MWVLHPSGGFLSAVQHRDDSNLLVVRARIKNDLADLASLDLSRDTGRVTGGDPSTDYPWRVVVHRDTWAIYVARLAMAVDYPNFKAAVGQRDGQRGAHRASIYSRVWTALLALEDLDPFGRADRMYFPDTNDYLETPHG